MRDILFRGIWVHGNKEWIEGDLVRDSEGKPHIVDNKYAVYWKGEPIFVCEDECEVIPETVGQYTGLTDKNGKKIFEGDICQIKGISYIDETPFVVEWNEEFSGWFWRNLDFGSATDTITPEIAETSRVIGNIHDNKELLEVK